jgi:hypothetical protein
MWGRVTEILLALWLMFSPFLFGHYPVDRPLWISDFFSGGAILLFSCISFYESLRRAHLMNGLIAGWLIGFGYIHGGHPAPAGYQHDILIGLILILIAIVPNHANQPPRDWQRVYGEIAARK